MMNRALPLAAVALQLLPTPAAATQLEWRAKQGGPRVPKPTDPSEKQRYWKTDWAPIYPDGPRGSDFLLIRVPPLRLEIVSESRGLVGDAKTWLPRAIDFPRR